MLSINTVKKSALTVAGLGALALGGAAVSGAADNGSSSSGDKPSQSRPQREALSSDVAAKVKAAALDKVPGATVLRTEGGGPYSTPYHAHIRTSDGKRRVVLVNGDFEATQKFVLANLRPGQSTNLSATGGLTITTNERTASAGDTSSGIANSFGRLVVGVTGSGTLSFR